MEHLDILMKEYDSLRQESLIAIQSRTSVLSFGLATLGAIFAVAVTTIENGQLAYLTSVTLILVVPLIAAGVASIWFGEHHRMHRAGRFIGELEQRVNNMAGAELLSWEGSLRVRKSHMLAPYSHSVTLIAILGVFGMGIGLWLVTWPIGMKIAVASVQAVAHAVFYGRLFVALSSLRK